MVNVCIENEFVNIYKFLSMPSFSTETLSYRKSGLGFCPDHSTFLCYLPNICRQYELFVVGFHHPAV